MLYRQMMVFETTQAGSVERFLAGVCSALSVFPLPAPHQGFQYFGKVIDQPDFYVDVFGLSAAFLHYDFIFEIMLEGCAGAIVLVSDSNPDELALLDFLYHHFFGKYLLVQTTLTPIRVKDVPQVPCDLTQPDSIREAVVNLVNHTPFFQDPADLRQFLQFFQSS